MSGTALFKYDSRGRAHYLLQQESPKSCGPACVAMIEGFYKLKCLVNPEERARQLSQKFPGNFIKAEGATLGNLHEVLNAEGVKAKAPIYVSPVELFDYLYTNVDERTPAIVLIQWAAGDFHFAVCRIAERNQPLIFLDPKFGIVEVEKKHLPRYHTTGELTGNLVTTYR
jgi:hypothetical protein